jgi:hypothetical protein
MGRLSSSSSGASIHTTFQRFEEITTCAFFDDYAESGFRESACRYLSRRTGPSLALRPGPLNHDGKLAPDWLPQLALPSYAEQQYS